jgi:c-di-GMP-binding flagellar brake protein YcgR
MEIVGRREHRNMSTEEQWAERRKETRYPVEAKVVVRKTNGETVSATAVNISSSGMRLCLEQPCPLALDEEVTVDVELPEHPDKPFSAWGLGRVAYIGQGGAGIQLYGGQFVPLPSGGEDGQ